MTEITEITRIIDLAQRAGFPYATPDTRDGRPVVLTPRDVPVARLRLEAMIRWEGKAEPKHWVIFVNTVEEQYPSQAAIAEMAAGLVAEIQATLDDITLGNLPAQLAEIARLATSGGEG